MGKDWVKQNFGSAAFKNSLANHLDKAIASGQAGQTIGIPIGPDTSRIVSEVIATELEEIARAQIPDLDRRAVRYVDDMIIGLEESQTPDAVLSKLSAALYEYELELNAEKTAVYGLGCGHAPEWIHFIRSFEVSNRATRQREDIDSFFEQAMHLADENRQENVLLFAAKKAASFPVLDENREHLIRWLLYSARRSSSCLSFVVEHIAGWNAAHVPLPLDDLKDYINDQIRIRAEAAHTAEVAWLIFWARELNVLIGAESLRRVVQLRSSISALLVFDTMQRGLIHGSIDVAFWRSFANADGLKSSMWLTAYEVTKKGWWPRPINSGYITGHPFFGDLWSRDVEFYQPRRRARARPPVPFSLFFAAGAPIIDYP